MIDWEALNLDPIYLLNAETAVLIGEAFGEHEIQVIDGTDGIDVGGEVAIPTIAPGVYVRKSELDSHSISIRDLDGATLEVGELTWRVAFVRPKPGATGKGSGEYILALEDPTR